MKYNVKWIEDNLGISRKTLRGYEDAGIIDKNIIQNPNNRYREYGEDDIQAIWTIRILQGIGYSLKEIKNIIDNPDFDFMESIENKKKKLEEEKAKIEESLGYVAAIKMLGVFPLGLNSIGDMKTDDFIATAHEIWNIHSDASIEAFATILDSYLHKPQELWGEKEQEAFSVVFENYDYNAMKNLRNLYDYLASLKDLPADDPMVTEVVTKIYEHTIENVSDPEMGRVFNPREFAIIGARSFTVGDASRVEKKRYGEEACEFIAKAIAKFGGYDDIEEIL